jgi:DNA-binding GntR family transcriptional regulator
MLAEDAYRRLKEAILRVELAPGTLVTERYLEDLLQVSRTPIRAALSRLEAEGLVTRRNRGHVVTPIDIREFEHAYEYREACEIAVVKRAIERASRKDIDAIDHMLGEDEVATSGNQWFERSLDFHLELARIVGNPFLLKAVQDAMTRLERVRWFEVWTEAGRERAFREHKEILRLVRLRRVDDAVGAMSVHIAHSREAIISTLRAKFEASSLGRGIAMPRGEGAARAKPAASDAVVRLKPRRAARAP